MGPGKETKHNVDASATQCFLLLHLLIFHTLVSMGFFKLLDKLLIPNIFGKELLLFILSESL